MEKLNELIRRRDKLDHGSTAPGKVEIVKRDRQGKPVLVVIPADQVQNVNTLVAARHSCNLSQAEFAKILGVPKSTYLKYEQYINRPPLPVVKLAKIAAHHLQIVADA